MTPVCLTCKHPQRAEIERAALAPGAVIDAIARDFGIDDMTIRRHMQSHLTMDIARASEVQAIVNGLRLVEVCQDSLERLDTQIAHGERLVPDGEGGWKPRDGRLVVQAVKARSTVLNTLLQAADLALREQALIQQAETAERKALRQEVLAILERDKGVRPGSGAEAALVEAEVTRAPSQPSGTSPAPPALPLENSPEPSANACSSTAGPVNPRPPQFIWLDGRWQRPPGWSPSAPA